MATVLQLTFPARRYHATPWAHHVNEGVVEWPPSPWRLLRALLATGFTKCGWGAAAPPDARQLIEMLSSHHPTFSLPRATVAHSRHYVDAAGKRPLILDAWARVEHDEAPIEVCWPVDLPKAQRDLLDTLAARVGYLGRAESWVEARLVEAATRRPNCAADSPSEPGFEPVRVLCPVAPAAYADWRAAVERRVDDSLPLPARKPGSRKLLNDRAKALAPYPADLVDALCIETGKMQSQGWSSAPGSQEVVYWRRADALEVGVPAHVRRRPDLRPPFVLFSLTTPSRNRSGLPGTSRVYPQGRLLHQAVASLLSDDDDQRVWLLGRDEGGPVHTGHRHAHLLHLDLDGDQRLDHALLWLPEGFDADGLAVLRRLRRTWMKGGVGELQVSVVAIGNAETLRALDEPFDGRISTTLGPAGGARRWTSATPYIAPRFTKRRGGDTLAGQINVALARRGLPEAEVEVLSPREPAGLAFRKFVLHDRKHQPPMPLAHTVRLTFLAPVEGPICLGYGSHYGLGRFVAEPSPSGERSGTRL